ncbi:MAG TPA: phospholipase, partial [Acidobacteriota bacterium]|nr:phospholipase [Acidobacteriota bacterium]
MLGTKATLRISQELSILTLVFLMGTLSSLTAQTFQARTIEIDGQRFIYRVYVPADWSADRQWPVILFLHGAGERGKDGIEQTTVGLGPQILQNPSRFPAIVVMPQCRTGVFWNDPLMEKVALGSLQQATEEFNGDPRRTYLMGLSM